MKIKVVGVLILLGLFISSCSRECQKCRGGNIESPIPLDHLESVNVKFQGTLYLYQDTFQFASVLGPEAAILDINRSITDGVWDVSYPDCFACEEKIEVVLVVPNIKEVKLSGSGQVIAEQSFKQSNISIINQGSGSILFSDLSVDSLNSAVDGSGNIRLNGEGARVINANLSGSGEIEMFQFPTTKLNANLSGSGNIFATVIEYLNAVISGSGNVYYKGAASVEKAISGSGSVIQQP
ncbi:MAG: DUF2807 domain-containing protein [Chitinophagales bacterium]|nr:DUF2807 domain-containing protein [Chitinophagales bacterium]MCZ2393935.1 DUF2807 domain-containing protein [Chitinophagales bacterium]